MLWFRSPPPCCVVLVHSDLANNVSHGHSLVTLFFFFFFFFKLSNVVFLSFFR